MPNTETVFAPASLPHVGFAGSLSFTFYWAARPTLAPGQAVERGRRTHAVLWLITEGMVDLEAEPEAARLTPGTLVAFPPGSSPLAQNRTDRPATRYVLSFDMRLWGEVDFFRLYRVPAVRRVPEPQVLAEPWEALLDQLAAHGGAVTLGAEGWARILVDRWLSELQASGELRHAQAADDRLTTALAAVDADLRGEWTVARLAELMHLSPVRVRQIFVEIVGVPPAQYLALRRIAQARHLLADTNLTSVEIAERCGFADPRHFSRVFHRLTGMRPTRYREQTRLQRD